MAISFCPISSEERDFFCTILRKDGEYQTPTSKKSFSQINPIVYEFLEENVSLHEYSTFKFEKNLYLVPNTLLDHLDYYKKHLYIKQVGIDVAEENHGVYHPTHGLAMLAFQHREEMMHPVYKTQALQYLSKETFDTSIVGNGFRILNNENLPLGFIKQIGTRHNNYYPKNWRILSDWRRFNLI